MSPHHGCPWRAGAELGTHFEHNLCLGQAAAIARLLRSSIELLHVNWQPQLCRLLQGRLQSPQRGDCLCRASAQIG